MIGLAQFIPALALNLVGGAAADAYDRKRLVMVFQLVVIVLGPARDRELRPAAEPGRSLRRGDGRGRRRRLRRASSRRAAAPAGRAQGVPHRGGAPLDDPDGGVRPVRPACSTGGFAVAHGGIVLPYLIHAALMVAALITMARMKVLAAATPSGRIGVAAIKEGAQFVWRRQVLLGSMALDMFAVIFGGAQALLPVYATDILHVGARGYGILAPVDECRGTPRIGGTGIATSGAAHGTRASDLDRRVRARDDRLRPRPVVPAVGLRVHACRDVRPGERGNAADDRAALARPTACGAV